MRYADLLVDLAAVVKASRSVARRHWELRATQVDHYGRTSSILRSLRQQQNHASHQGPVVSSTAQESSTETRTSSAPDIPSQSQPAEADLGNSEIKPQGPSLRESRRNSGPTLQEQHEKFSILEGGSGTGRVTRHLARAHEQLEQHNIMEVGAGMEGVAKLLARAVHGVNGQPPFEVLKQDLNEKGINSISKATTHENKDAAAAPTSESKTPDDVPPDVDINVFHTNRGYSMLDGHKDYVGKLRPTSSPPTPSWFKDYGHGRETAGVRIDDKDADKVVETLSSETDATTQEKIVTVPNSSHLEAPELESPASGEVEEERTPLVNEVLEKTGSPPPPRSQDPPSITSSEDAPSTAHVLRESKVPASRLSRLWNYGGLAAGMLGGAISEGVSRGFGGGGQGSVLFSSGNMERLVAKLSRMRGAALKLGQIMSFQDSKMLPAPIQEVLQRVQDRADYMPAWQRDRVLIANLGPEWRDIFDEFEEKPIAAASIGQVHKATLKSTGEKVAVKIQFPGVADSINSDLDNLSMLLTASKMLPKGLYLDKTINNARTELGWECDYEREAQCGQRYRELLADEPDVFIVPKTYPEASGKHVLTMEFMEGVGVTRVKSFTQEQSDWIGTQILRLCLREITEFRFMQTDPNWTNFLYNASTHKLELLDFGASRAYPDKFVVQYVNLLAAAARSDRHTVKELSESLGYLTGHESKAMLDAHVASVLTLAEPFLQTAPETYDFSDQTITERVKALIPVMIHERLAPPPEETYSLHRKLSGAFLLCARLGSHVRCRELFEKALERTDLDVKV